MRFKDDENAFLGTLNLILVIVILAVIGFAVYYVMNNSSSFFSDLGTNSGQSLWGLLSGGVSGFFGGAWNTGKNIGNSTSGWWNWRPW